MDVWSSVISESTGRGQVSLAFIIYQLPPAQRNKNAAASSRGGSTVSSATILDDEDVESDDNGIISINSDDDEYAIQAEEDTQADDKEGGDRNKKNKRTTLQEDIRSFIHIVQDTVQDNVSIKKAFDKLLSHVHNKPAHDGDESSDAEDANADLVAVISEETRNMDAMTAGIVSALLAPALMGPPPPPSGPPPRFPPHFGRPPHHLHHHHRGHGGPHGGRHHFGPPPPPRHEGPGGIEREGMPHGPPPFFRRSHEHFDNADFPSDDDFEAFHLHRRGRHGYDFGHGRELFSPGMFRHGKNRGCPYDMPPPPPPHAHHPFHGMMPHFGPGGDRRHGPSFMPRRPPPFSHVRDPSVGFFGKYGPGPGPHRHGHRGRHAHFFQGDGRDGLDDLRGGFENMRMNNDNPNAFEQDDDSTASSDESEIEFIQEKRFERFNEPLGRHGYRSARRGPVRHGTPPPPPHHKHGSRHGERPHHGPAEHNRPHANSAHHHRRGPRPHGPHGDLPRDGAERHDRHTSDSRQRHGDHHARWA